MAFVLADNTEETTDSTGTGTVNLRGATTGNQTFVAGIGNGNTTRYCIKDANGAWEVGTGTVTDATPDTLSRTLISSSTGSLLNLSGSATVYCDWSAQDSMQSRFEQATGADANTTMTVGTMYVVDMSAWATADRTYTLPAVAAIGDRVGIMVSVGNASYELLITAASGDTLNGIAGGTEWSRLFIVGEVIVMRCVAASATWMVEYDGRIAQQGVMRLSTATDLTQGENVYCIPTSEGGAWTADVNLGSCCSTSDSRMYARRAGSYQCAIVGLSGTTISANKKYSVALMKNGTTDTVIDGTDNAPSSGADFKDVRHSALIPLAAGDYLLFQFRGEETNRGLYASASPWLRSAYTFAEKFK